MSQLRTYQEQAIEKMRQAIRQGYRKIVFVLPTGGGKSHVFGQIIRNAVDKGNTVLWLVHRRNLVLQMQDVLRDHFEIEAGVIMSGVESNLTAAVQIGTIQTYARRLLLDGGRFFVRADVVMVDESHRSVSKSFRQVLDIYKDKIILGCTATPMRADGRGLGEIYETIVDIANVKELTLSGYLSPARYFAAESPDLSKVKISMGDYAVKDLEKAVNKTKLVGDIVENWLKYGQNRRTIVFCVNVKHSIAVCEAFNKAGVQAEHLSAISSDEERADVFRRMEDGDTRVVCNVALYQEGLDVPNVSCIVMARPTKSLGLYRQCLGRGLRPAPNRPDCLVFDHAGTIEENGFLEDEIEWTLDGKEKAWAKKKDPKEKKPVKCSVCNLVFQGGSKCPDCGSPVKTFGKKIDTVDGELKELSPKKVNQLSWSEKRMIMAGLVWYEQNKGWNPGRKAHLYKTLTSAWPNDKRLKGVPAAKPEGRIYNLIQYAFIKSAKAYKKSLDNLT